MSRASSVLSSVLDVACRFVQVKRKEVDVEMVDGEDEDDTVHRYDAQTHARGQAPNSQPRVSTRATSPNNGHLNTSPHAPPPHLPFKLRAASPV